MNQPLLMRLMFVLAVAAALFGWAGYAKEHRRADKAERALEARSARDEFSSSLQAAVFLGIDGDVLTYGTHKQVVVDGQTFVDIVEHTARLADAFTAYDIETGQAYTDRQFLQTLTYGTPMRVLIEGTGDSAVILELHISP